MTMNGAYLNSLDQSGLQTALAQIPGSVTTDYILFSLNVASGTDADINFGLSGPVLATGGQATEAAGTLLSAVVKAGVGSGTCQRVWLSLGGWGSDAFTNIQAILNTGGDLENTLMANFAAIVSQVAGIQGVESVGFDMDYEQQSGDLASLVAAVTVALHKRFGCPVTFCPYQEMPLWIGALQEVYATLGTQPVVGFNLQTYAGGSGNNPQTWTSAVADAKDTGVSNPSAFIWPIVSCDPSAGPDKTPGEVTAALQGWKSAGASLWATAPLPYEGFTLTDYSKAIAAGIG